ncbi:MAG: proline--tRNA ligase [Bdellovibrionales bacterium RBG_16_40_8]|nr:MAG: proline--tRNA ligase [Bdellovibrionales bacterium RBG_16_40_8]
MKWTKSYIYTLKETPADAEIVSHKLMVRGGYIKKVSQGIFTYGPLALRSIRKFENIVREELNKRGCVEILMPMVQPKELWQETNRWSEMGKNLLKFKNRTDQEFCLGATHEEIITDFIRRDIKSYRDLPVVLYQIQTKYRDEIRPRFGLLRGREFLMKDAYSFDRDADGAIQNYKLQYAAYTAIFKRLGVNFVSVKADSGNIGGSMSEEFHILAEAGEDALLVSENGDFAANVEVCPAIDATPHVSSDKELKVLEKFATTGLKSIDDLSKFLKIEAKNLVKTLFYSAAEEGAKDIKPVCVLLRGSDELNSVKLKTLLDLSNPPLMLTDEEVKQVTTAWPGSCGPVGLKIPIYMDNGVEGLKNYVVGANEDGFHLRNVNHDRDFKPTKIADLRTARHGDKSPNGKGLLKSYRGIEVGHIFYLGSKYSKVMNASYLNEKSEATFIEMGCYGIGISRTVQAVIEQCNDKDGIIWPVSIAPFHVHICLLDPQDAETAKYTNSIYEELLSLGVECLLDDREERPGVKFKDADLLGMPLRLNIGKRGVSANEIEMVIRKSKETIKISLKNVVQEVSSWVKSQM